VAISVDTPKVSADLRKRAGYTFTFLSDPNTEVIRRYDLLHRGGGPDKTNIARPAEFLVDRDGVVRWTNFTEDIRVRARADEMLAATQAIR
jgi:peroxiredoxin